MNVPRYLKKIIEQNINKQKVIRIFGTRRTGKSTLLKERKFNVFIWEPQKPYFV